MGNNLVDFLEELSHLKISHIAFVGIGNALNGDDAAGPLAAQLLIERMKGCPEGLSFVNRHYLILDAGPSPEAFTGPLRRFAPEVILLMDAAELCEPAGTVRCFDWSLAQGLSASTHTMPPTLLAGFLIKELGCRIVLLGIQPGQLILDGGISAEVSQAVKQVVENLAGWL